MPDILAGVRGPAAAAATRETLLAALADAVLAVPGVVRLEPTLSTSGPRVLLQRSPFDGLHVLTRADGADVDVNVVTSATHQARTVAHQVQAGITDVLAALGYTTGAVSVSILTIDRAGGPPDLDQEPEAR